MRTHTHMFSNKTYVRIHTYLYIFFLDIIIKYVGRPMENLPLSPQSDADINTMIVSRKDVVGDTV